MGKDEMKLKIGSNFLKGMISKIITKTLVKKLGYKVDVKIEDLDAEIDGSDVKLNISVGANMKYSELTKILNVIADLCEKENKESE